MCFGRPFFLLLHQKCKECFLCIATSHVFLFFCICLSVTNNCKNSVDHWFPASIELTSDCLCQLSWHPYQSSWNSLFDLPNFKNCHHFLTMSDQIVTLVTKLWHWWPIYKHKNDHQNLKMHNQIMNLVTNLQTQKKNMKFIHHFWKSSGKFAMFSVKHMF